MAGTFWRPWQPAGKYGYFVLKPMYKAATVCKRGHPSRWDVTEDPGDQLGCCIECGATMLAKCKECGARIRGDRYDTRSLIFKPPAFCDNCGRPHPWATRQQRIYELENLLDEDGIKEADRLVVRQHLDRLRTAEGLDPKEQVRLWSDVKAKAPRLLTAGKRIAETIMTDWIKREVGL